MTKFILIISTLFFMQESVPGLKQGDKAPVFIAKTYIGNTVNLSALLKNGPVVLFFYRGAWCPYCNRQMSELQDSANLMTAKGATILAISPETNESMKKMIEKSKANFTFISDNSYKIMDAYKVSFKVDAATIRRYKLLGLDVEKANGNNDDILPIPATYVIGKDGIIKYAFFNKDYKKRASIKEVLSYL